MKTKKQKITPEQLRRYKERREKRALTVGSEWIYFNQGADGITCTSRLNLARQHIWNGCAVRITKARKTARGSLILKACLCSPMEMFRNATAAKVKPFPPLTEIRVLYSELW